MTARVYPLNNPTARPAGPYLGSRTYASAIAVANALVTSVPTSVGVASQTLTAAAAEIDLPALVTVTTSASVGTYKVGAGNPIVVTGTNYVGVVITDSLLLTATGGGETVSSTKAFQSVTSITTPGQNDAGGLWTFGVGDVVLPQPCAAVRAKVAGTLSVVYPDGRADAALDIGAIQTLPVSVTTIKSGSTGFPLTVFL